MRPCVIIPTYDNPATLEGVVREAHVHLPHVIVVDDGSGPSTKAILRGLRDLTVVTHDSKSGKGAALRTGFETATRLGFTHAISLDADGQHLPGDIPSFLEAATSNQQALILGVRNLKKAGAGLGSRLGRRNSNFWAFMTTGLRIPDTQTGFRCYPLDAMNGLYLTANGFDFEVEVLVKSAWTGVPVISIPIEVRYFRGDARVSHMRPCADFLRIAHLYAKFTFLRICLPAPYLATLALRDFRQSSFWKRCRSTVVELLVKEPGSPRRVAASVGLGLFMGIAPVWGFQVALTLLLAHWMDLSKPISVLASHISFPLLIPAILYASLVLGRFVTGVPDPMEAVTSLKLAPADLPAWILGSLLLAAATAAVGATATLLLLKSIRRIRQQ